MNGPPSHGLLSKFFPHRVTSHPPSARGPLGVHRATPPHHGACSMRSRSRAAGRARLRRCKSWRRSARRTPTGDGRSDAHSARGATPKRDSIARVGRCPRATIRAAPSLAAIAAPRAGSRVTRAQKVFVLHLSERPGDATKKRLTVPLRARSVFLQTSSERARFGGSQSHPRVQEDPSPAGDPKPTPRKPADHESPRTHSGQRPSSSDSLACTGTPHSAHSSGPSCS